MIYLIDTFIMLSFIQLLSLLLMIFVMFAWRGLIETKSKSLLAIIRTIQVLSIAQVFTSFCLELPFIHDKWLESNDRVLHLLGLSGMRDNMPYSFYSRVHYVLIAYAICLTELVATSFKTEKEREQRVE